MKAVLIETMTMLVVTSALLGQTAEPLGSRLLRRAVSVTVTTLSHPDRSVLLRVGRVEMAGDDLRLEIQNTASVAVVAIDLRYELSGCGIEGFWATAPSVDGRRQPGMASVDIPANGRVWYEGSHMASYLASSALARKTRYLQARPEVLAAVFSNGEENRWEQFGLPKHPMEALNSRVCKQWLWNDDLNAVQGFRPPSRESGGRANENLTYTCTATDGVLTCPE